MAPRSEALWVATAALLAASCSGRPCEGPDEDGPRVRIDVALDTCNQRPVARIDAPGQAPKRALVSVHARDSVDPEGGALGYRWRVVGPDGGDVPVDGVGAVEAGFVAVTAGAYEVGLVVSDGDQDSEAASRTVRVRNTAPVADAGPDTPVPVGQSVALDGTGSADEDGDPLTFSWRILQRPANSTSRLSDPTDPQPRLLVDVAGVWELGLVVDDGEDASEEAVVRVGGGITGGPPVAVVGPRQSAFTGQTVPLDGSASLDPDGDPITFAWRLVRGPARTEARWTAPTADRAALYVDQPGVYEVELVVDDGFYRSAPAAAAIDVGWGLGAAGDLCDAAGCQQGAACVENVCVGVGRLRFSLTWTVVSDFDLHVMTAEGVEIYFGNTPAGGGELDVDDCIGGSCRSAGPHVENIVFEDDPPPGRYQVWVENFDGVAAGDFGIEVRGAARGAFQGSLAAAAGLSSSRFMVVVP